MCFRKLISIVLLFSMTSSLVFADSDTKIKDIKYVCEVPGVDLKKVNRYYSDYEVHLARANQLYYGTLGLAAIGAIYAAFEYIKPFRMPSKDERLANGLVSNIHNLSDDQQNRIFSYLERIKQNAASVNQENNNNSESSWSFQPLTWAKALGGWTYNTAERTIQALVKTESASFPGYIAKGLASGLALYVSRPLVDKIAQFALSDHNIAWFVHKKTQLNSTLNNLIWGINKLVEIKLDSSEAPENSDIEGIVNLIQENNQLVVNNIENTLGYLMYVINHLPAESTLEKNIADRIFKSVIVSANAISESISRINPLSSVYELDMIVKKINLNISILTKYLELVKSIERAIGREELDVPVIYLKHSLIASK